jgi:hypothetical protein
MTNGPHGERNVEAKQRSLGIANRSAVNSCTDCAEDVRWPLERDRLNRRRAELA